MPLSTEKLRDPAALSVVVLEHNDTLRSVLRDTLSARGFGAVAAFGDLEAFRRHTGQRAPEVLVLDMDLPGEDGLSLLSDLRTAMPDVALMAMSAQMHAHWRACALNAGADHLFVKPVLVSELLAGIRRVLHRRVVRSADVLGKATH